jgi:hypothetical protein
MLKGTIDRHGAPGFSPPRSRIPAPAQSPHGHNQANVPDAGNITLAPNARTRRDMHVILRC